MKQATFYLLEHHQPDGELDAVEALACDLAAEQWRSGKRILIACQSQEQAVKRMRRYGLEIPISSCHIISRVKVRITARPWNYHGLENAAMHRAN